MILILLFLSLLRFVFSLKTYHIDSSNWASSQVFDGFGAVSGGGATSKLLFTYFKTESERKRVMEVMFNKENGLQILKVEMGGDDQSTEGSESSHMTEKGQISRNNYEFRLIREALRVNPSLPICVLPWTFPGWLGDSPYDNDTETAGYVVEWLKIGRETWKFETFCVGVWNERNFSESYVKELRRLLDAAGFQKTLIVAGEGFRMDKSYARLLDKDFINSYDIIGVHYPGGKIPANVQKSGKTIWASEDYSTDNRETGMGCMARTMNWNYVNGNITGMLTWHLMSAFYPQLPWWRCGLASLQENQFQTEDAFHVLKYVTGHVKRGWRILAHGKGSGKFGGGGTYVTYTDGKDFTIVLESMSWEKSLCEYSSPKHYSVKAKQQIRMDIQVPFKTFKSLKNLDGLNISLNFQNPQLLPIVSKKYIEFNLPKDSFGVITTLPISVPSEITVFPPPLPYKYSDDFSDYENGEEPRFWMPQKGSWEVRNGRAVQKVIRPPISWCTSHIRTPYAVMAYRGKNSSLSADVSIPEGSNATSIILGLRSNCSGKEHLWDEEKLTSLGCDIEVTNCRGIFVEADFKNGTVEVFSSFVQRTPITSFKPTGKLEFGKTYTFSIHLMDSHLFVKFGKHLVTISVEIPEAFIEDTKNDTLFLIGTGDFGLSEWDNMSCS